MSGFRQKTSEEVRLVALAAHYTVRWIASTYLGTKLESVRRDGVVLALVRRFCIPDEGKPSGRYGSRGVVCFRKCAIPLASVA